MLWRSMVFFVILLTLMVSGCLQVHTVVKVRPDGSGTIEEITTYGKSLAMMKKISDDDDEEKEIRDRNRSYGDGVRFVSVEKVKSKEGRGHRVTYAFNDINTLRLNQNPKRNVNITGATTKASGPKTRDEYVTFRFTRGSPAKLVIMMPAEEKRTVTVRKTKKEDEMDEDGLEMAQWLLGGFKILTAVEFDGRIVETDASFRKGSRVTLVDLDFNELLTTKGFLQEASSYEELSLQDAKALMKKYPGVKVELNREVTVKFR